MADFDAVSIEHSLARFFGQPIGTRGAIFDADVLRGGDPKDLAELLSAVADTLESRLAFITFTHEGRGSPKSQATHCVRVLRETAARMAQRRKREREDYHWEIFGALISGITGLLETLESQVTVQ
mgnify:CR=1 FL=1